MKQLTCEMCGSTDLLKQDGVFVCQSCGTKYSVEEAKKMMIEGNVDVSGSTIKVDNSAFVEKYLANARRAKQKEDWEETEKYYNMVEQNEPTNIEAIFYSSYGKAKHSLVKADLYERQAAFKVLENCVSLIDDNYDINKEDEQKEIVQQISDDIFVMATSEFVYNRRKNGYGFETWNNKLETVTLFNRLGNVFCNSLENIARKYPEDQKEHRLFFYQLALKHAEFMLQNGSLANPDNMRNIIMSYHKLIEECEQKAARKKAEEEEKKRAEQQARNENYWTEHAEEKKNLESELNTLKNEIKQLQEQLSPFDREINELKNKCNSAVPSEKEKDTVLDEISKLRKEQGKLGLFKGKEKKALKAQIGELTSRISALSDSIEKEKKEQQRECNARIKEVEEKAKPIKGKITAAQKRVNEINTELAKNR